MAATAVRPCHRPENDSPRQSNAFLLQLQPVPGEDPVRHGLGVDGVTVGRGDGCDIRLNDPSVSRRHAGIATRGNHFYVHDLNSTNGTYVNEEPTLVRVLQHGDKLRLGDHLFRFVCEGSDGGDQLD